jgi:succinate dehydrogenase / fumarate reductase, cytochrome b subunit
MLYKIKTGMLAWILFRLTGLALVFYLALHITVISNLHDPTKFNDAMAFLGSWQFRFLEIGLFILVLIHALNGIRIFIVDFFNGSLYQAKLFWVLAGIGFVLFIAGAYPMVSHALYWKKDQTNTTMVVKPAPESAKVSVFTQPLEGELQ